MLFNKERYYTQKPKNEKKLYFSLINKRLRFLYLLLNLQPLCVGFEEILPSFGNPNMPSLMGLGFPGIPTIHVVRRIQE